MVPLLNALLAAALAGDAPQALEIVATDAKTGKPLEGAVIRLFNGPRPTPYLRTDAQGRATTPYPPRWSELSFDIHTANHVQQRVQPDAIAAGKGPPAKIEVKLFPGDRTVGGRLVDERGKPVVGATVRLGAYLEKPRHPSPGIGELICDVDATTDQDGRWRLGCVEGVPSSQGLDINHPDFLFVYHSNRVPAPLDQLLAGTLTTVMKRGIETYGRVVDEKGQPIAGATVVAGDSPIDLSPLRRTGADGAFRFASLAPGRNMLTVQAPGRAPAYRTIEHLAAPTMVEFKLPPGRTLHGRVADPAGKPLPFAGVYASFPGRQTGLRLWTTADAEGKYTLADAPQDAFTVSASQPGYAYGRNELALPGKLELDFTLTRTVKLRGTVVDAETGQPVPKFTAAHNTCPQDNTANPPSDLPAQFGFNQHFHESKGKAGKFELELPQKHDYTLQVGVWAPGYRITRSEHFKNDGKDREFTLKLRKETRPKIAGVVRRPDGKPAAGALAYLANRYTEYEGFKNGGLTYEHRTDRWQRCDPEGRFSFPPQDDETVVGANHDAGWATAALPAGKPTDTLEMTLAPWARIEGAFLLDGKPKAGEKILFMMDKEWEDKPKPYVRFVAETLTGADGRFVLDRVVAGPGTLRRFLDFGRGGGRYHLLANATPKPGATLRFPHARQEGRTVVGRLKLSADLKGQIASPNAPTYVCTGTECQARSDRPWVPYPPDIAKLDDQAKNAWWERWNKSPEGVAYYKAFQHVSVWMEPDGRIRMDGVNADRLVLTMPLRSAGAGDREQGELVATVTKRFEVPPMKDGYCDEPFDLGEIAVQAAKGVRRGQPMPEVVARGLDGGEWKLSASRGKVVVVDVWATWCGPCVAALPKLAALQTEYGGKGVELVGLNADEDAKTALDFLKAEKHAWRQCHVGAKSKLLEELGVEAYPSVFVVGRDGTLLYRGYSVESAADAVRAALPK